MNDTVNTADTTYIKIDTNIWVSYDLNLGNASVVNKKELKLKLSILEDELKLIPEVPSDKVLLQWAMENYPFRKDNAERNRLIEKINRINEILVKLI